MIGSGTAGRLSFDRSSGENRGPGRGACACCAGVRLYFLGWGPVKYEAINAAKSCLWPLIREGIVTSIVIFRQNN